MTSNASAIAFALAGGKVRWAETWDAVDQILVARVAWGDNDSTALVAAISIGGGDRAVIICQLQREWALFMDVAQKALPGSIEEERWEPAVSLAERGLVIYDREAAAPRTAH